MSRWPGGAVLTAAVCACGRGDSGGQTIEQRPGAAAAAMTGAVPTAAYPRDPCGWIPPAEVEALIGPFTAPPRPAEGGCRYALVPSKPAGAGPYTLDLHVDLTGDVVGERALTIPSNLQPQQHEAGAAGSSASSPEWPQELAGWDYSGPAPGGAGFVARAGHLRVILASDSPALARERIAALVERTRDRIADLPFPVPRERQSKSSVATRSEHDPCQLLGAAEAEAVLGKLVVAPYRAARETPFADPLGPSCAYFTPGHRVLVVTPEWTYGRNKMEAVRGIGGWIATIERDRGANPADTPEAFWDDAAADEKTGELFFLKGDRLLQIGYATSSTNSAGAARLARTALQRMQSHRGALP